MLRRIVSVPSTPSLLGGEAPHLCRPAALWLTRWAPHGLLDVGSMGYSDDDFAAIVGALHPRSGDLCDRCLRRLLDLWRKRFAQVPDASEARSRKEDPQLEQRLLATLGSTIEQTEQLLATSEGHDILWRMARRSEPERSLLAGEGPTGRRRREEIGFLVDLARRLRQGIEDLQPEPAGTPAARGRPSEGWKAQAFIALGWLYAAASGQAPTGNGKGMGHSPWGRFGLAVACRTWGTRGGLSQHLRTAVAKWNASVGIRTT